MKFAVIIIACALSSVALGFDLMDELRLITSQGADQKADTIPLDNVLGASLQAGLRLAVHSCQESFRWQRWNCPSTDFFYRYLSHALVPDSEDAYVAAISTAAILYTITKDCASDQLDGCGCGQSNGGPGCPDDPLQAEELYDKQMRTLYAQDFYGSVRRHNQLAITTLLRSSIVQECSRPSCCRAVLKPFAAIAQDIRRMYDESLPLSNAGRKNTQVIWQNVPLDALVFVRDSPNYCEPDAVPQWNGMRGRQCSRESGEHVSDEEQQSCRHLCRSCGYQVRAEDVVSERRCNCKFTWSFQVYCDTCVHVERQYYCY